MIFREESAVWFAVQGLVVLVVVAVWLRRRHPVAAWYCFGFPAAVARVVVTWRALMVTCDLTTVRRPARVLIGGEVEVSGRALRPNVPRLGVPRPTRYGLVFWVRLLPGQTPDQFEAAAEAMAHAWRVHAVRVDSPARGLVRLTVLVRDPLASPLWSRVAALVPPQREDTRPVVRWDVLRCTLGTREDGRAWVVDLAAVPHWLITGATRSGKSTLLLALLAELMPRPVALVGIDCKGGVELGPLACRFSGLACSRAEAVAVLDALIVLAMERMRACRLAGVRSVWELLDLPVPVVVVVDEIAELYLATDKIGRDEAAHVSTSLLRLAQLGAALGVHLVIAGQRVGSELGSGVTALRAQLGGRVCHRVSDPETAVMTLGDIYPEAAEAACLIQPSEQGVAVTADEAGWVRVRSARVADPEGVAARSASASPPVILPGIPLPVLVVGGGDGA